MAYIPKRRKEDSRPSRVWAFFRRFFMIVGIATSISVLLIVLTISRAANYRPPDLPDTIVLTYTLKDGIVEKIGPPSLGQPLLRPATTLHDLTKALRTAAKDKRVKGLVMKLEDPGLSLAQIQELRDAVHVFKKSKKFAWIFSETYGGFGGRMSLYYLASAFDTIWMQPVGAVAMSGIAAEVPFFKGFLDKIGITAEFEHIGKYKSAPESLTETQMSEYHREMMAALLKDLSDQIESGIAKDRNLTKTEMEALVNKGIFADTEALAARLIDKLAYYDDMTEAAKQQSGLGPDDQFVALTGYEFLADETTSKHGVAGFVSNLMRGTAPAGTYHDRAKIALIYGAGDIIPYARGNHGPGLSAGAGFAADKTIKAFHLAVEDEDVAAIVFRIDSPGGSPSAAESIRQAILSAKKKGKPVIVSMSSAAASGGYWLASSATKIVAQPGTVTGSIGVFGGKIEFSGLAKKLGVGFDGLSEGPYARMWSSARKFSDAERTLFVSLLQTTYDAFLDRVAEGRKIPRDKINAVAEGRIFTGRQAKTAGLVDALGGLDRAIRLAKKEAQITDIKDVPVIQFPPKKSALEMFFSIALEGADAGMILSPITMEHAVSTLAGIHPDPSVHILRMPDLRIR